MMPALDRRIRRHVVGRDHVFKVVVTPGLEPACLAELAALDFKPYFDAAEPGVVVFTGRLTDLYRAHLHLRTATRILFPVAEFKAVGFGALSRRTADIPWDLYLAPNRPVHVRVTARRSRLRHSSAVAQRVTLAVARVLGGPVQGRDTGASPQVLYVRVVDDRVHMAVDATGEPLYKRGIKTHGGRAPLRESLAAAMLMMAGFTGDGPVRDPMCGSGTFALEAALLARRVPPGLHRDFAFAHWPSFQPRLWAYLVRQASAAVDPPPAAPQIIASDRDAVACERLSAALAHPAVTGMVRVVCSDFFNIGPNVGERPGIVAINPPYGRRLGADDDLRAAYARIGRHLAMAYAGWRVVLVMPRHGLAKVLPFAVQTVPVAHGGLTVFAATGTIGPDRC